VWTEVAIMNVDDIKEAHYAQHKGSVINSIQRIIEDDPDIYTDEFKAFNYLAFDLFSDAPPESFVLTDGPYDQGIDFYTQSDRSYEIFQCKFAGLDTISGSDKPLAFDQRGVDDLEDAYKYLTGAIVSDTANNLVKQLRARIVSEGYDSISFNLCIFGHLTEDAEQKFGELKHNCESASDKFNVQLNTWKNIILYIVRKTSPITSNSHKFRIYDRKILTGNDYCYFLGHARDLRDAFQQYGWSLFYLNVRSEIRKSRVNKEIVDSIVKDRSRKRFHHLNNGILLMCKSYKVTKPQEDYITINDFQVINGCQTVVSINKAFDRISSDKMKASDFDERCLLQVKAIQQSKSTMDMVDQIIISTNNQNPMSLRNLKSNTDEQKEIKSKFYHLPKRWFYQRKDGEFDALKSGIVEGSMFRKADYKDKGDSAYRVIDNQDLAKTWTCFCGFSYSAMMTSDFFKDDKLYERIFKRYPTDKLWNDFFDPEIELDPKYEDYFDIKQPTAEEYLLSYLIWGFIKEYSIKPVLNRRLALERGVRAKKLQLDNKGNIVNSQEDQARYLIGDTEYMINNIINNSKEVMLEMYSFVLAKRYGTGYEAIKRILKNGGLLALNSSPDFKAFVRDMDKSKDNLLFTIYEFLRFVLSNLYVSISGEYTAASRRKSYLATSYFVKNFKKKILETEGMDVFKNYMVDWKDLNKSFLESMPTL
jgi:hypothetical protein